MLARNFHLKAKRHGPVTLVVELNRFVSRVVLEVGCCLVVVSFQVIRAG